MTDIEALQLAYLGNSPREYRRSAGQFFTPRWIANGMASWVIATSPRRIVDPAFGLGMLLDACKRQGYQGLRVGYENDAALVKIWKEAVADSTIELSVTDFLAVTDNTIEAAIVNPPYNRFQNRDFTPQLQLRLSELLGEVASGYTNQYAIFIYLVVSRLSHEGRAAFIVPSEFLATGYGVQVKRFLKKSGRLQHLIIFDTESRIFPEAATTACVLLFGCGISRSLKIWHLAGESDAQRFDAICKGIDETLPNASIDAASLDPAENWQGLGFPAGESDGFIPLGTFGKIQRGIATGANEFFVLSRSKAASLNLDSAALVPCIANANAVTGQLFSNQHWRSLREQDRSCFLFDGIASKLASAQAYVAKGERQNFHQRYLTSTRQPWYRLESRNVAPLLLAVFGRQGFRVILNRSDAVNLTAFHGFHPKPGYQQLVEIIWLYFQTAIAHVNYSSRQRAYGDGLKKLEPGDWSKLLVPDWRGWDADSIDLALKLAKDAMTCSEDQLGIVLQSMEALVRKNLSHHVADLPKRTVGEQLCLV
ncbi:MAG: N-6 DNA methylase [Rhodoferax sp.]|jgi:adenine-specific DNA-methyltransferase|nr:N-6 DNA methylase [Rhodoferax sp.]